MTTVTHTSAAQRILVALDGSEPSMRALAFGAQLARCCGWRLDVATIVETPPEEVFTSAGIEKLDADVFKEHAHRDILEPALASIDTTGVEVTAHVDIGHVVTSLLEQAEQDDVALVVIGLTGKGPFRRMLEGSVSRGLSGLSPKPVVVVP